MVNEKFLLAFLYFPRSLMYTLKADLLKSIRFTAYASILTKFLSIQCGPIIQVKFEFFSELELWIRGGKSNSTSFCSSFSFLFLKHSG